MPLEYFKSSKALLIFALVYMDGPSRADMLEMNCDLYYDANDAYSWYESIKRIIVSDPTIFKDERLALHNLDMFYSNMIDGVCTRAFSYIDESELESE